MPDTTAIPNPTAAPVMIQLDHERHLLFEFNSKVALEYEIKRREKREVNLFEPKEWNRIFKNFNHTNVRMLLWASLLWEDPELQIQDVGRLLEQHMQNFTAICEAVAEAMKRHLAFLTAALDSGGDSRGRPLAVEKTPAAR